VPFRLLILDGERTLRIPLTEGEWIVGSSPDADIRIIHPTVSRSHARLTVETDGVFIEDLGSSNGTRIDGDSVHGKIELSEGKQLRLGSAVVGIETLEERDSALGIPLSAPLGSEGLSESEPTAKETVTQAPSVLEQFTNEFLPEALRSITTSTSQPDRLQAIGNGLFHALPCLTVEIVRGSGANEAVAFSAERGGRKDDQARSGIVTVSSGDEWVVRVDFPAETLARAYEPLVRSAALLAGLPIGGDGRSSPKVTRKPGTAELPAPATVSPRVQHLYSSAARVAAGPISVLIHGESGTGKEILARFIHAASRRAEAPLVTLNCAALPGDLLEAELFGVEKGVATGVDSRPGRFEQAHGGTLFLDEIGDMALETQAKILRALQEKEVYRLGSGSPRPADVRVVSATNRDINGFLESGAFRSDLYHRIADWVVELPPLRHRREDIPNLAVFFLSNACAEAGVAPAGISKAALDVLKSAPWPGNIRQLEREMSRVALFLEDDELLATSQLQSSLLEGDEIHTGDRSLKTAVEDAERDAIREAIAATAGDVVAAAKRLDVGRSTLYRRMAALGITE
jgi:transcriptional regulator with AAA-type ATPase domain/pSer/pThr/pTyr-binding forkhead associated (FHA) protein